MELLDDTAQSDLMDRQRHYNMMSTIRCSCKYPCKVEFSSPSSCSCLSCAQVTCNIMYYYNHS